MFGGTMFQILEMINRFVWGVPALVLILGVGIYLSIRTGFVQITLFPKAFSLFIKQFSSKRKDKKGITPYQALCTALAATVGTGNLAGVAGAIAIGGPGAVFWMWVCALLGMVTKFAEATLSVRYRVKGQNGEYLGGPMYMICNGLGKEWTWLASVYCFFGVIASFGVGNATQINTVISGLNNTLQVCGSMLNPFVSAILGCCFAALIAVLLLGGAKRIGIAAERIVPIASIAYIILGLIVLLIRAEYIPGAFRSILVGAFSPKAVTGGVLGSGFLALRVGASRGVFTNEAGMGTASIAHGGAEVDHPVEQGLMGIMEVFIDTIVICTMTALVILCSGISIPYGKDVGITLTNQAFSEIYGQWVSGLITLALCCFALATVLGWGLYGIRCAQYLFGERCWRWFVLFQAVTVVLGSVLRTETVWTLSEIVNGLMAIPNLIALALLSPELIRIVKDYKNGIQHVRVGENDFVF